MKKLLIGLVALSSLSAVAAPILIDASCKATCTGTKYGSTSATSGFATQSTVTTTAYAEFESKTRYYLDKKTKSELKAECTKELKSVHGLRVSNINTKDVNCLYFKAQ